MIDWPVGKHITKEQLEVFEKKLNRRDIPLFSEVRILFSRLMVSRKKRESESDILKLLKPEKKELLMHEHEAFGRHSDLSEDLVRHLDKKLMEQCREKRGAFKLTGTKNTHEHNTRQKKSERVTLNFDNDATDGFIRKLVTPPSTSKSMSQEEKKKKWKGRNNIVLKVRGTEQFPETTASDVVEHLKEILKEVVHRREALEEALKKVTEYCAKDPSEILESLSSVSSS